MSTMYGDYRHQFMSIVSFSAYQAIMVGGWTQRNGGHRLRNYW